MLPSAASGAPAPAALVDPSIWIVITFPRQSLMLTVPVPSAVWPRMVSIKYCESTVPPLSSLLRLLVVAANMIMAAPPIMPMLSTMMAIMVSSREKPSCRVLRFLARPDIVTSRISAAIHPGGHAPRRCNHYGGVVRAQHAVVLEQVKKADRQPSVGRSRAGIGVGANVV